VMSPDETRRLLAVADSLKVRTLLGLSYSCGLRANAEEDSRISCGDCSTGMFLSNRNPAVARGTHTCAADR
jgi:hypothetical protein